LAYAIAAFSTLLKVKNTFNNYTNSGEVKNITPGKKLAERFQLMKSV
jgi:hypothetical protein